MKDSKCSPVTIPQITSSIFDSCGKDLADVDIHENFVKCGHLDSLSIILMVTGLEKDFNISLLSENFSIDSFTTLHSIKHYIMSNIK